MKYKLIIILISLLIISCGSGDKNTASLHIEGEIDKAMKTCMLSNNMANTSELSKLSGVDNKLNAKIEFYIGGCVLIVEIYKKSRTIQDAAKLHVVESHFIRAIELDPSELFYKIELGVLYDSFGDYAGAVQYLEPLFLDGPLTTHSKYRNINVNYIHCLYLSGKKNEAIKNLYVAIKRNSFDESLLVASLELLDEFKDSVDIKNLMNLYIEVRGKDPELYKSCDKLLAAENIAVAVSCYSDVIMRNRYQ